MSRGARVVLVVATAVAIAALGAGAGALLYSQVDDGSTTTTVVSPVAQAIAAESGGGLTINDIYKHTYQGVVDLKVTSSTGSSQFFGGGTQQAEGSGFVYNDDGYIVTNQHVVGDGGDIEVTFWNGDTYKATLVDSDYSTDIAVIKVEDAPSSILHPIDLGDSDAVQVGDTVVAIGSPFGLSGTV